MGIDIKSLPKPVRAFFNGIAQVGFIENVISGAAIYVSFWIAGLEYTGWNFASWDSWKWVVFTTIGVNIANLVAYLMGCDHDAITSGLYGFCPNLFAMGCCTFGNFEGSTPWAPWVILCIGEILITPAHIFINKFTGHFGLPGFTFPFNVMTWFMILATYQTEALNSGMGGGALIEPAGVKEIGGWMSGFDFSAWNFNDWALFATNGFEEIWVADGWIASVIIIAAYLWFDWQFGLKACLAQALTVGVGMLLSVSMGQMHYALFGYSALLAVGALDTFGKTKKNSGRYWFLWFFACFHCILFNYAITAFFGTFGLPNVTFAFVLTGWVTLIVERFMIEQAEKRQAAREAA